MFYKAVVTSEALSILVGNSLVTGRKSTRTSKCLSPLHRDMEWNVLVYLPPASCCILEVVCVRYLRTGLMLGRIHVRNEPQSLQNVYAHGEQLYRIWRTLVLRCVAWQKLRIFHWKDLGNNKELLSGVGNHPAGALLNPSSEPFWLFW